MNFANFCNGLQATHMVLVYYVVPMGTTLVTPIYSCTITLEPVMTIISVFINVIKYDFDLNFYSRSDANHSGTPRQRQPVTLAEILVTHSFSLKSNFICSQHWNIFHHESFPRASCSAALKNQRRTKRSGVVSCEQWSR